MQTKTKIGFILGIVVIVSLLVLFARQSSDSNQTIVTDENTLVSSDWKSKYDINSYAPYGLALFEEELQKALKKNKQKEYAIHNQQQFTKAIKKKEKALFLFIGDKGELLEEELEALDKKISEGSILVTSFHDFGSNFIEAYFFQQSIRFYYDEKINVKTKNEQSFQFTALFQADTISKTWEVFNPDDFYEDCEILSTIYGKPNFVKIKYGLGEIYFHANPDLFFNHHLIQADGQKHAQFFLKNIGTQKSVYWLSFLHSKGKLNEKDKPENGKEDDSYLGPFFNNSSTRTALILLVIGLILFYLFRTKRTKPLVEYLPTSKNRTLAFAGTITSIYQNNSEYKSIVNLMRKNFHYAVQKHFYIDISKTDNEKELIQLAEKCNMEHADLKSLNNLLSIKYAHLVDEKFITDLAVKVRDFYLKHQIISTRLLDKLAAKSTTIQRTLWISALVLITGIIGLLIGFYGLSISQGWGIILALCSVFILWISLKRMNKPFLVITKSSLTYYPLFQGKKELLLEELKDIEETTTSISFKFSNQRSFTISRIDISRFDRNIFKKFIHQLKQNKL
jgi:hypothetical protein